MQDSVDEILHARFSGGHAACLRCVRMTTAVPSGRPGPHQVFLRPGRRLPDILHEVLGLEPSTGRRRQRLAAVTNLDAV